MIHSGTDGWLFLTAGTNNVLRYFTSVEHFSDEQCEQWRTLLETRAARAKVLGVADYFHMIAPDKLSVYREYYRDELPFAWRAPSRLLPSRAQSAAILDLLPVLEGAKRPDRLLYWKTDSHWSFDGAFAAYEAVCERLEVKPVSEIREYPHQEITLKLDLGSKLDPPVTELLSIHKCCQRAKRTYANEIVQHNKRLKVMHQGAHVAFENDSPRDPRTVLLFGDSYAEHRDTLLTGMLAETFAKLHFVWHSNIDWQLVERLKPEILISEIAERFMNVTPDDTLDLEKLVAERLATASAE